MKKKIPCVTDPEQERLDREYMEEAILLAREAEKLGEVPVGAILVMDGQIIARAHNLREKNKMATAHAELLAIEEACRKRGDWRLSGACLYVTMEPCPMCAGAIVNARIDRVVYGAKDYMAGCCGSLIDLNLYPFNHSFTITRGVCGDECRQLLKDFFVKQRQQKNDRILKD